MGSVQEDTSTAVKSYELSPLDQITARSYTDSLLCFPFPDQSLREDAVKQIKKALYLTFQRWPEMAGHLRVINQTGTLSLEYSDPQSVHMDDYICTEDSSSERLSYPELANARFPPSAMSADLLPLSSRGHESDPEGWPVFRMQINFLEGGLTLAIQLAHSFCDGGGRTVILEQLANNLRSIEEFAEVYDTDQNDSERGYLWKIGRDRLVQNPEAQYPPWKILPPNSTPAVDPVKKTSTTNTIRRMFALKPSMIISLKELLSQGSEWPNVISSWDALVALLWVTVMNLRLRSASLNDKDASEVTRFVFPIDTRSRLKLSKEFLGNAVILAIAEVAMSDILVHEPLFTGKDPYNWPSATIAALRVAAKACRAANMKLRGEHLQDCVAFTAGVENLTLTQVDINLCGGKDLYMVSHASIGSDIEWPIKGTSGGKAAFIRRPGCPFGEGYCMIMQRRGGLKLQGDADSEEPIELFLQLKDSEMEALCDKDSSWMSLVEESPFLSVEDGSHQKWIE